MRLGKRYKFNIILAILLCMAFAVDIGVTLSASAYSFFADSGLSSTYVEGQSYIETAEVVSESGAQVAYNIGSIAHNIDVSYGFSNAHDLMLTMTISYNNGQHPLNDFSLNFVDRSKWMIDTPTSFNNITNSTTERHYSITSSSNSMTISMYYVGSLSGSDVLPVISGVTFYNDYLNRSSGNLNVANYAGDYLTIEMTAHYSKCLTTYSSSHTFNANAVGDKTSFNKWIEYKNGTLTNSYTVYNNHGQDSTAILFPQDFDYTGDVSDLSGVNIVDNSMTAYEYTINNADSEIKYSKLLAGNKYSGGVGVYVYPQSTTAVNINVIALWEKGGQIYTDTTNPIHLGYSNDLVYTNSEYYYKKSISEPTYINVLEYIMLTAQGSYNTIWQNGYKLIISSVTVEFDSTSLSAGADAYAINNSTTYSPILARYRAGAINRNTNVSITSHSTEPIQITAFTVRAKLWYAINDNPLQYNEQVGYITNASPFAYNSDLWQEPQPSGDGYRFTANNSQYITYGYEMQLINGISIPSQTFEENYPVKLRDLWCAIEVVNIEYSKVDSYSARATYSNIEVSAPNQFAPISAGGAGYISIKNNTNQIVTSATLTLTLQATDSGASFTYDLITGADYSTVVKDNANSGTPTSQAFTNLKIYPNERVVLCKIIPTLKCTIASCSVQVTLTNDTVPDVIVSRRIEQTNINYNRSYIVNNSTKAYQVRINSEQDLSKILSANDFVFSADKKYAYYIGIVYPKQVIDIGNGLTNNVKYDLQLEEYNLNSAPTFTNWGASGDTKVAEWKTEMGKIFNKPTTEQEIKDFIEQIKNA